MDELIKEYAKILENAIVGDYTYEGILSEFARKVVALETQREQHNG